MGEHITLDKLKANLDFVRQMYDAVRLVDPVTRTVLDFEGDLRKETTETCYHYWKTGRVCENCISMRAYLANKCYMKLEQSDGMIMMVTAIPIEGAERPTVLELLKDATESMLVSTDIFEGGHPVVHRTTAEINDMISKDKLTGIYNRRYVDERLIADVAKSRMEGLPLSIVFMDIDNLKDINDSKDHAAGDKTLHAITRTILHCIRTDLDWAARYGGDEFIICLRNTGSEVAEQVAERIRSRVAGLAILHDDETIHTSVSIGVHTMQDKSKTAEEIIALADRNMYEAKQKGKNRIVASAQ
ncbi:MAG: GGDEF domain-containing protein [Christensenellales bacterium]